jgi:hypothetical protein
VKTTHEALIILEILISDFVSFADEAFFVVFAHVGVQLVVAEETLVAECAQGVHAASRSFFHRAFARSLDLSSRWQMGSKHGWRI